jgi:hypothetical protein
MPFDRRLARLAFLCTMASLAGACSVGDFMGPPFFDGPIVLPKVSQLELVALNGSGVDGNVSVWGYDEYRPSLTVLVQGVTAGASYPMHLHAGRDCSGAGVPVADDLGAPTATAENGSPPAAILVSNETMPALHLRPGYYFDVHAPGAADASPIGCAAFVD